jgi:D-inositol-3-phosphate glycosyltransferase
MKSPRVEDQSGGLRSSEPDAREETRRAGRIADLIVAELAPRTVLDAGCTVRFLVEALRERGVEACGVSISEHTIEQARERDYDLIVCIGVLEHLAPHIAPIAVANLCGHTNEVLFSATPDEFRDPTHLNVQPTEYWVELFGRHGFFRNLDVDASVIAPEAIHFLRANQTAVSVARAYERRHWSALAELRDLRAARQIRTEAARQAEQANAEIAALRRRLEDKEVAAERTKAEMMALRGRLEDFKAAADEAQAETAALLRTRLFRYTSRARSLYGRFHGTKHVDGPHVASGGVVRYSIEVPSDGQVVERDLLVPVQGWVICQQGPVARIDVVVNGVDCGKARLGVVRSDVATNIDRADALVSGFETLVDLRNLAVAGPSVRIELVVETLDGERHALPPVRLKLAKPGEEEEPEPYRLPGKSLPARGAPPAEIRLLVFTHHLGLGGGQLYLFELLRLLSRVPDLAATVVAPAEGPLREATEALGMPVVVNGRHPLGRLDQYEARQAELGAWARGGGFNAVLGNTLDSFPNIDLAARLGLPAVWAIHESLDLQSFWRIAYGSFEAVHPAVKRRAEDALASAAAVVFEADATRELFVHHGDPGRFVTVPYGIDLEEIERYAVSVSRAEARRRLQLPVDATILLCLGTIEPRKAQTALAEAFTAIAPSRPDVILAFVGTGPDESSAGLYNFVEKVDLASRIRIVPMTPDINLWYRAADALVCASDLESLPRTVLESMAFSVPVIATRVFGLPELIDDRVTGYLFEPRDIGELVRVLNRFLSFTVEEREAVGAAGAKLVRERHDSHGYADAYHRLLRSLIEDPSRLPSQILAGRS